MSQPLTKEERDSITELRRRLGLLAKHDVRLADTESYLAIIDRLCARITTLEGSTGFCVDCEARQRRIEKLEAALQSVHEYGYTTMSDFEMVKALLPKEPS